MKTGTDVQRKGLYASDCCVAEVELQKEQMFPRCPHCLNLTLWFAVVVSSVAKNKKAA
jgi:hypothetical protein